MLLGKISKLFTVGSWLGIFLSQSKLTLPSFSGKAFLTEDENMMKKKEKHLKGRTKKKALKWPGNKNGHLDDIAGSTLGKLMT